MINKNNTAGAKEAVVMSLDDFDFSNVDDLTQEERNIAVTIDKQNRIEAILSDLDWVNSASVNIAADRLAVSTVLDVSREPSPEEADAAAQLITMYVDGLQKEDVVIIDQNSNVIY
ncbi:MAG: hypothetical protein K2J73_06590 [Oscillospiraceae bacterium]|nr:hypothetical protein [Oscillospiraceae bacterium]